MEKMVAPRESRADVKDVPGKERTFVKDRILE